MAVVLNDDKRDMHEDQSSIQGNVFDNDKPAKATPDLHVVVGSLENDGVGTYGTLVLDENGNYTYTITDENIDSLAEGNDVRDSFKYFEEYYDEDGNLQKQEMTIQIDIHGKNDQPLISDVHVSVYEGDVASNGDRYLLANVDNPETPQNEEKVFEGTLTLGDIDPTKPGVQTDVDTQAQPDTHTFVIDNATITVTSNDLTDEQLKKIKDTIEFELVNPNAHDGDADFGKYKIKGDFDALSEGNKATITVQYKVIDENQDDDGDVTSVPSDPKTITVDVIGKNDAFYQDWDPIYTYDELVDGDIYKTILSNDKHWGNTYDPETGNTTYGPKELMDVNDKIQIINTGYADLAFWKEGGTIDVDNAEEILSYKPGANAVISGQDGAIAKNHFDFFYQATDSETDPIWGAYVRVNMENKDGEQVDFYQFGDNSDDAINGIKGKSNVLSGLGGNDYLEGKEKSDILYGGDGDDALQGGWGNDIYKGGKGSDGIVDSRGADLYVFSKGDGRDSIDDTDLEIYTDAMGHEIINARNYSKFVEEAERHGYTEDELEDYAQDEYGKALAELVDIDVVKFDDSVDYKEIALFQEDGQFKSLLMKYSKENADDKVSIGWQEEDHYGVERVEAVEHDEEGNVIAHKYLTKTDIDSLVQYIATFDIDANTAGVQTAQNVQDVQNNTELMAYINAAWHTA